MRTAGTAKSAGTTPGDGPHPFRLNVSDEALSDLHTRLSRTRWTDSVDPGEWDHGTSVAYLRTLVDYWLTTFDWRAREREINALPQFELSMDGSTVHFLHFRGSGDRRIPLIVTHGWPGSFFEMVKLAPLLCRRQRNVNGQTWSFDVVVPSIPGFGFSSRPTAPGLNAWKTADVWAALMTRLGYERFVAQGGDFGAAIGTALALRHQHRLLALHLNYIPGSYEPPLTAGPPLAADEQQFRIDVASWREEEGAYAHLHATRAQTLGVALNDSPAGLAAWLIEKYRSWADCDGDLERRFTRDELLTHVMVYWVTETIHSSMRYYAEMRRAPMTFAGDDFVNVPVGIARFPREAPFPPRAWIARGYNIVHWSDLPRGGHFAAWEEPELLADDLAAFVTALELP